MLNLLIDLFDLLPKAKSWQQTLLVLVAIVALTNWSSSDSDQFDAVMDYDESQQIGRLAARIKADAIVIHTYSDGVLTVRYSSNADATGIEFSELSDRDVIYDLKLGNCTRTKLAATFRNDVATSLICPIVRKGKLVGAISGVYTHPPLIQSDGSDDPIAAEIFLTGTAIN